MTKSNNGGNLTGTLDWFLQMIAKIRKEKNNENA